MSNNQKQPESKVNPFWFIPSKAVRKAIEDEGRIITDFEKATLVYNSKLPLEIKWDYLQLILEETADEKLRKQLKQRLDYDHWAVEEIKKSEPGFVFGSDTCDYPYDIDDVFSNFDAAYKHAENLIDPFFVRKFGIQDDPVEDEGYREIRFLTNGAIKDYGYESPLPNPFNFEESDPRRFENHFLDFPNPFKQGDVVRAAGECRPYWKPGIPEWGIVDSTPEDWEDLIKKLREVWAKYNKYAEDEPVKSGWGFFDAQIISEFLTSSNTFIHEHHQPIYLDYYEIPEDTPKEEKELIKVASLMVQGKASLDWFTHALDSFAEDNRQLDESTEYMWDYEEKRAEKDRVAMLEYDAILLETQKNSKNPWLASENEEKGDSVE